MILTTAHIGWIIAGCVALISLLLLAILFSRMLKNEINYQRRIDRCRRENDSLSVEVDELKKLLDEVPEGRRPARKTDMYQRLDAHRLKIEKQLVNQTQRLERADNIMRQFLEALEDTPEATPLPCELKEIRDIVEHFRTDVEETKKSYLDLVSVSKEQ